MIYRYSRFFVIAFFCTIMTSKAAKLDEEKGNGRGSLRLRMGNGKVAVQIEDASTPKGQLVFWKNKYRVLEKAEKRLEGRIDRQTVAGKNTRLLENLYIINSDRMRALKKQIEGAEQEKRAQAKPQQELVLILRSIKVGDQVATVEQE